MLALFQGIVIGLGIAAPVGPIGVLVLRRTLAEGRLMGLVTGLGAATADALYGMIGALGLTVVSRWLIGGQVWLRMIGGLFLCYLGVRTLLAAPAIRSATATDATLLRAYLSTLLLTLANPLTILSFAAIFAGLGVGATRGNGAALLLVLGVFAGSALWWLLLSGGIGLLRGRVSARGLRAVNFVSGAILLGFGSVALLV